MLPATLVRKYALEDITRNSTTVEKKTYLTMMYSPIVFVVKIKSYIHLKLRQVLAPAQKNAVSLFSRFFFLVFLKTK